MRWPGIAAMMIRRGLEVSIPRAGRILRPTVISVRGILSSLGHPPQDVSVLVEVDSSRLVLPHASTPVCGRLGVGIGSTMTRPRLESPPEASTFRVPRS